MGNQEVTEQILMTDNCIEYKLQVTGAMRELQAARLNEFYLRVTWPFAVKCWFNALGADLILDSYEIQNLDK